MFIIIKPDLKNYCSIDCLFIYDLLNNTFSSLAYIVLDDVINVDTNMEDSVPLADSKVLSQHLP